MQKIMISGSSDPTRITANVGIMGEIERKTASHLSRT